MRGTLHLPTFAVLVACNTQVVGLQQAPVTYNGDSRQQYFEASPTWQRVAEQTAIMVEARNIRFQNDGTRVLDVGSETLGASQNLCEDQRYRSEPTAGSCSATLVGPRHLLTAGHCVLFTRGCASLGWVFGLRYDAEGQLRAPTNDDIYVCSRVLAAAFRGIDYAVVELDRDVVGRTPAVLETERLPNVGEPVTLIGYPSGIPVKIDTEGVVTTTTGSTSFGASVDAFGGNSGSGVFSADGRIVGVLTAGERDYIARGACTVVNDIPCIGTCGGENVVRATSIFAEACVRGITLFGTCPVREAGVVDAGESSVSDARAARDARVGDAGVETVVLGGGGCTIGVPARSAPGYFALAVSLVWLVLRPRRQRRAWHATDRLQSA